MTSRSPFHRLRCTVLTGFLALAAVVLAVPARADDIPKFKDPLVTEYCTKFAAAVDRLVAAKKAKDSIKAIQFSSEIVELQKKYLGDVAMKVDMSELDAYHAFIEAQNKKVEDANSLDDFN